MARRKDHTPEQLRSLIRSAARKLLCKKGLQGLTARALAIKIGYAPGTIYNVYRDMDSLILDINFETLGKLDQFCQAQTLGLPKDSTRVRALAYAYVDFAHKNQRAWESIFAIPRKGNQTPQLPEDYRQRILSLFARIENTLQECLNFPRDKAGVIARLLWACLHGITVLTLDGRLKLVGVAQPHAMIDALLRPYLGDPSASSATM